MKRVENRGFKAHAPRALDACLRRALLATNMSSMEPPSDTLRLLAMTNVSFFLLPTGEHAASGVGGSRSAS
jgi:hypothetical protein